MKVKSVLMVVSQYPPVYGGAGKQAALLSTKLAQRGIAVNVATLDQNQVGNSAAGSLHTFRAPMPLESHPRVSRVLSTFALTALAVKLIVRTRPDAVHIHGAYWWSIGPAIVGRLSGAVVIVKVTRDGEDDPLTVQGRRWNGLPLGRIYGLSFRLAHHVIFLSDSAAAAATEAGLELKARRLNNGVDLDAYLASTTSPVPDVRRPRVVLFAGYLVVHKGVSDLLRAWELVQQESDAELWLAGPETGFYRELGDRIPHQIQQAKDAGLKIRTLGYVAPVDMPALYLQADVFTLPSYNEGMPNSLAEGLVAGCTIVATNIPGIVDLVDERQAYLVEPGDVNGLAEAILKALSSPIAPLPDVIDSLNIDSLATTYIHLYGDKR